MSSFLRKVSLVFWRGTLGRLGQEHFCLDAHAAWTQEEEKKRRWNCSEFSFGGFIIIVSRIKGGCLKMQSCDRREYHIKMLRNECVIIDIWWKCMGPIWINSCVFRPMCGLKREDMTCATMAASYFGGGHQRWELKTLLAATQCCVLLNPLLVWKRTVLMRYPELVLGPLAFFLLDVGSDVQQRPLQCVSK